MRAHFAACVVLDFDSFEVGAAEGLLQACGLRIHLLRKVELGLAEKVTCVLEVATRVSFDLPVSSVA